MAPGGPAMDGPEDYMAGPLAARRPTEPRSAGWRRVSVIDVGSNSVRLVVHDVCGRAMQQRYNEKVLAGLGRGLSASGRLNSEGVELALQALKRFSAITRAQTVDTSLAFATAAVREADDGQEFCRRVEAETGLRLRVLSGADEARLAALGALASVPPFSGVIGDLGGSSLELAICDEAGFLSGGTYPLGPLALDSGSGFSHDRVLHQVRVTLARSPELRDPGEVFVAVGGSWRAIASIHMELVRAPLHVLQNYEMDAKALLPLLTELATSRRHSDLVSEIAKKRAPTIPYAATVLRGVLEAGRFRSVLVSAYGVREGVIVENLNEAERRADPLAAGLESLTGQDAVAEAFGRALWDWLAPVREAILSERLTRAACRIADIGAVLHPDHRAQLAFDLVARAPLPGLTHRERAALALAIAVRYKRGFRSDISDRLLDADTAAKARALGGLIRLACDLSGRSVELLEKAGIQVDQKKLRLVMAPGFRPLVSEAVLRRLQSAAQEIALAAEVVAD